MRGGSTIRSSQVGRIAPRSGRDGTTAGACNWRCACCANPPLDALITGESAFETLPQVMARADRRARRRTLPPHPLRTLNLNFACDSEL